MFIVTLALTLNARFGNRTRIVLMALGLTLSVGVSMAFAQTYNQFVAGFFIYAGAIYTTFM